MTQTDLRVLHVIPTIALEHGGPSQAVRVMASSAAARGARVDVVATSHGTPEGKRDPSRVWELTENGVVYRLFPQASGSRWNFSVALTTWLFSHVRRYDVAHVHAPFSYPTWPGCRACQLFGVPYLYRTIGALDPWSLRRRFWKKWPYFWAIERPSMRGAFAIHVTSQAERRAVEALGASRDRVVVIPIGVGAPGAPRQPPSQPPLRVLFLGRLHPKKGVPLLIEAVRRLRANAADVVLTIAGDGDGAYVASLHRQVQASGLSAYVEFVGFVARDAKTSAFARAHVFALPAYDENFGISVAEAMAHGLPVVISDGVGIADEVLAAGAGHVCKTGNAASLTQALQSMLSASVREACARGGVALTRNAFSIDAMTQALLATYTRARTEAR